MAKWLKDYLSFGSKRMPPQPPKPDYSESEILKAYRVQKSLDFEDPYEDHENRSRNDDGSTEVQNAGLGSPLKTSALDMKVVSPKHRLIKVDSQDLGRTKILLSAVSLEESPEPVVPSAPAVGDMDYSDPFDARRDVQPESHAGTARPENNGYMEPYEAQRVLAELQRRAGGRGRGGVQLYDTPYEERGSGLAEAPEEGRESRLPQDDERPADEYDQPWEWKKEHISKAFAGSDMNGLPELPWPPPVGQLEEEPALVQFECAEWDRSSSPDRARSSRAALVSGSAKLRKPSEPAPVLGERVDPTLPLEKQVWYHGALSRSDAESLLTLCKESSYLVRISESSHSEYSLSLRSCQGFMHMKFSQLKDGKYVLGQNSQPFGTIPEVIHYYTRHKLPIRGAEHLSLLFPVLVQTL
ncbi:src homology 2 domain containing transforming protein D, b isoform X2 [Electrophorus electricus]|uniref:src homology 2 domain containing transforming protein D, b isoform X2 n=1 Tax=Electrophorus electricus TaxID=8005 RepID=UPI0015CFC06B|nr:src homology 2 domain containing transforming protein D, b isoform X2 [Electrophorus electricus]